MPGRCPRRPSRPPEVFLKIPVSFAAVAGRFNFGDYELDVAAFSLRQRDTTVRLEKIPMEVLILLVRHAGTLVARDSIFSALWGSDVFLDRDAAINTAIRKIRKALGEDADRPRFVETVVGKGYRFVGPVVAQTIDAAPEVASYRVTTDTHAFVLMHGDNVIGRNPDVEVFLDHRSVSRRHARISIAVGRVVLEDLNSRNGTCVDGRSITSPTELHDGAIIRVGPITLTFLSLPAASTERMSGGGDPPDAERP
jgi:DNA-binding winged helix-turn-helix (wHTH) protein